MKFRELKTNEIECRVAVSKESFVTLLLYKDARCDMNILDETVGSMNWQREHTRDNKNCIVSIFNKENNQWIKKEDTGTESFTEKEKGLASDSFKRACFNWGIGRELYTGPFIYININKGENYTKNTKWYLNTKVKFKVSEIGYDKNRCINKLIIKDNKGDIRFSFIDYKTEKESNQEEEKVIMAVEAIEKIALKKDISSSDLRKLSFEIIKSDYLKEEDTGKLKTLHKHIKNIKTQTDKSVSDLFQ